MYLPAAGAPVALADGLTTSMLRAARQCLIGKRSAGDRGRLCAFIVRVLLVTSMRTEDWRAVVHGAKGTRRAETLAIKPRVLAYLKAGKAKFWEIANTAMVPVSHAKYICTVLLEAFPEYTIATFFARFRCGCVDVRSY